MTVILESKAPPAVEAAVSDRRRPGRLAHVSPKLIPLLRAPASDDIAKFELEHDESDQMSAMRGLALATVLSAGLWAGIVYVSRLILT